MQEPVEGVIICAQWNFNVDGGLNLVKIELEDDRIINILKRHKSTRYKLTPTTFLFPASVKNNTEQISITCRELNDVKTSLINCKIYGLLGIINLNKTNNWKQGNKSESIWIKTTLQRKTTDSRKHICFSFTTTSLNDLLSFSIYLIDDKNNQIEFGDNETKVSILNFKTDVFT